MKVTALTVQQKNPNRVNVMVDGRYRLSLDMSQIVDLRIKVANEYSEEDLRKLETESQFGKVYSLCLEYCLVRPRSAKEVRDYLFRKTIPKKYRSKRTGEIHERPAVSTDVTSRVFSRLVDRGHIDDKKFANYWCENRNQRKGSSMRKLRSELMQKGVDTMIIDECIGQSARNDHDEIRKIIIKKRPRYPDDKKLTQYLARQGFSFDDIKSAIEDND